MHEKARPMVTVACPVSKAGTTLPQLHPRTVLLGSEAVCALRGEAPTARVCVRNTRGSKLPCSQEHGTDSSLGRSGVPELRLRACGAARRVQEWPCGHGARDQHRMLPPCPSSVSDPGVSRRPPASTDWQPSLLSCREGRLRAVPAHLCSQARWKASAWPSGGSPERTPAASPADEGAESTQPGGPVSLLLRVGLGGDTTWGPPGEGRCSSPQAPGPARPALLGGHFTPPGAFPDPQTLSPLVAQDSHLAEDQVGPSSDEDGDGAEATLQASAPPAPPQALRAAEPDSEPTDVRP